MATPIINVDEQQVYSIVIDDTTTQIMPSKTYAMILANDFDDYRIIGTCDGIKAAQQWINKALSTYLNCTEIYGARGDGENFGDYGSEFESLIGGEIDYAKAVLKSLVIECLQRDDRFISIEDESVSITDGEQYGSIYASMIINVFTGTDYETVAVPINYSFSV